MNVWTVYDNTTGEIGFVTTGEQPSGIDTGYVAGQIFTEVVNPSSYKVNLSTLEAELKTNIPAPATLTTTVNTPVSITGLPESSVTVNGGDAVAITDGTLAFTTDLAGDYTLVFTSPIYLDTTTVITVTE